MTPGVIRGATPRVLVCGWAGAGNVGDELLTRAIVALLRSCGAAPVVASRDTAATRAGHRGVEAIPWGPRGLTGLGGIDGVVVGPGGIIQDSSSRWSLPGHLVLAARLARRGLPVAGIGLGAEPLHRTGSGGRLRRVLAGRPVLCRDEDSAAVLRSAGVEAEATCDLAFSLDFARTERRDQERRNEIVVAIGPSVASGSWRSAASRLVPDDHAAIAAAVDARAAALGASVAFVAFRGERDRDAAVDVAGRVHAPCELITDGVDQPVERVSSARLLVTSRYHPVVVAASTGTPTLVVSEQAKVRSLVAQIDDPLVTLHDDWSGLGEASPPTPGSPVIPPGTDRNRDVVARLVGDAAAHARRRVG